MSYSKRKALLIDSQYLPPVSWFGLLAHFGKATIDCKENFVKASYRNRAYISGPNGKLRLSVPLIKGKDQHTVMDEVRISYDHDWQRLHWESLCSCYRRSPFFEFYEDDFRPYYEQQFEFLWELNDALLKLILNLLELQIEISYPSHYIEAQNDDYPDCRSTIHPKREVAPPGLEINPPSYPQVFMERTGFISSLSIVDLLFNEGPASRLSIENMLRVL